MTARMKRQQQQIQQPKIVWCWLLLAAPVLTAALKGEGGDSKRHLATVGMPIPTTTLVKTPKSDKGIKRAFQQVWGDTTKAKKHKLKTKCKKPKRGKGKGGGGGKGASGKGGGGSYYGSDYPIDAVHDTNLHMHWIDSVYHYHHSHPDPTAPDYHDPLDAEFGCWDDNDVVYTTTTTVTSTGGTSSSSGYYHGTTGSGGYTTPGGGGGGYTTTTGSLSSSSTLGDSNDVGSPYASYMGGGGGGAVTSQEPTTTTTTSTQQQQQQQQGGFVTTTTTSTSTTFVGTDQRVGGTTSTTTTGSAVSGRTEGSPALGTSTDGVFGGNPALGGNPSLGDSGGGTMEGLTWGNVDGIRIDGATFTTEGRVIPQDEICSRYRVGFIPQPFYGRSYTVSLNINAAEDTDEQQLMQRIGQVLREDTVLRLLGCHDDSINNRLRSLRGRRGLQEAATTAIQIVDAKFQDPTQDLSGSCTQAVADVKCIPATISSEVFYVGNGDPSVIEDAIEQALLQFPDDEVAGLVGFGNIRVAETTDELGDGSTSVDTIEGEGVDSRSRSTGSVPVKPIAFSAAAVASLMVVVMAILLIRHKRVSDNAKEMTYIHDDELDQLEPEIGSEIIDEEEPPRIPRKAVYMFNDDVSRGDSLGSSTAAAAALYPTIQHGPYESCSSPTCEVCEENRRRGTRFVRAVPPKPAFPGDTRSSGKPISDTVQF